MAFQSVPNCAIASIRLAGNSTVGVMTPTFTKVGGDYTQGDIDVLAATIDSWMASHALAEVSDGWAYTGTTVRGLENENDYIAVADDNAGQGELASPPTPSQVSFVVKFTTGLTGRSARGRAYWCGLAQSQLDTNENLLKLVSANQIRAAWEDLGGLVLPTGWTHVVVSRQTAGAKRPVGIFFPVTGYSYTDRRVDTQRGRLGNQPIG